jgi:SAM-dependent methyltransferase
MRQMRYSTRVLAVASVSPVTRVEVESAERATEDARQLELAPRAPGSEPDYIERNRAAWDRRAAETAGDSKTAWADEQLRWGLWNTPESELQLLRDFETGADVIELGCGAAAISGWLARNGHHPVAVDISRAQLKIADQLQSERGVFFPLIAANAEEVPFDKASFDVAISEYGASLWCNPRRWLPEAHRLLRPGGQLIFFTNAAFLMACTPPDGAVARDVLVRDYFSKYRVEFPGEDGVEFHLTHGHWIRLLRATGFVLDNLLEVRPPANATPRFNFVSLEWARRWPSEEIWIARKAA